MLKTAILCTVQLGAAGLLVAAELTIPVDTANPQWTISPRLVGMHQVYGWVPDSIYSDGGIAAWARRAGISTSRFPGGTVVKYWDWEHPSGQLWTDNYAPGFNPANNVAASQWMSLDEYLAFVVASGIHPHFGVNMGSGASPGDNASWPLISESACIARAVRMVTYVKNKGYGGAWWYLGNEQAHWHGGTVGYAQVCKRYAQAMKAVDPAIKLFWNANGATAAMVKQFLANDGGMTDGLETHGKWPNDTPSSPHTLSNWQNDFPLKDYRYNRTWRYYANTQYRKAATEVGRTILVANNEYGFGEVTSFTGFTRYTKGLLLTEFLMEMFLGNWDMSCFWDICLQDRPEDGLLDAANNYRFNPFCFGMNMLADAQGGAFLTSLPAFAVESVDPTLHGFAARKDGVLLVYLLNKSNTSRPVTMQLQGASYPAAFARRMQNSTDGYGEMVNVTVQGSGTNFTCTLPSFTFTEFTFADPAAFLKIKSLAVSNGKAMLSWSSLPGAKFTIEQSANLIDWEPAQSNIAPDNLWTDSELDVGAARNRFFRLRLQP